jgi:glycerol-3-phosphate dehydrogenase (NAD(P)+)
MKLAIIGAGGWGTALSLVGAKNGHRVTLWGRRAELIESLRKTRVNADYLPDVKIPETIALTHELSEAVEGAEVIGLVVPSHGTREVCRQLKPLLKHKPVIVSNTKGIEIETGMRMSEVVADTLGDVPFAVMSGPSHAEEVSRGMPTALVVASDSQQIAALVTDVFMNERFRIYSSDDVVGVEMGGALKNVVALAAGASDGIGFGDSAKAALVTRGLAEMTRIGAAMGAKRETFAGLSGMGDVIATCFSKHSRNRRVGERLGRGESLDSILNSMMMVAEGVKTTRAAFELARKLAVSAPITTAVYAALYEGKSPQGMVKELMTREAKAERA